jgi:hypothetical protein
MDRGDEKVPCAIADDELSAVGGARWKRNGVIPGYVAPEVYYDDGINVHTSDPSTSNVGYDSPFTPIPA